VSSYLKPGSGGRQRDGCAQGPGMAARCVPDSRIVDCFIVRLECCCAHEVMRPSVVTASRIDAKAIFGKGASIVLSPGSSPLVLVGNWMNYRDDAETSLPWVKIESGAASSFVTSIGNTFWTTRTSPFEMQSEGRLISSGDMVTTDYGRTLTPLATISSHMLTIRDSPYHIGSSFDDFQVDSSAGAANVTLPPARLNSGRKLTVSHAAGSHAVLLHASLGDGIVQR
jgi:hypothetical protein